MHPFPLDSLLAFLDTWVLKATLIFVAASAAVWMLHTSSAALRHLIWLVALGSVLVLPLVGQLLPGWTLPIWRISKLSVPAEPRDASATKSEISGRSVAPLQAEAPRALFVFPSQRAWKATDWSGAALIVWGVGTATMGLRTILSPGRLRRIARRHFRAIADTKVEAVFADCTQQMGVSRPTGLVSGGREFMMPMTWGFWRPTVLLPEAAHQWSEARLIGLTGRPQPSRASRRRMIVCSARAFARPLTALHSSRCLSFLRSSKPTNPQKGTIP